MQFVNLRSHRDGKTIRFNRADSSNILQSPASSTAAPSIASLQRTLDLNVLLPLHREFHSHRRTSSRTRLTGYICQQISIGDQTTTTTSTGADSGSAAILLEHEFAALFTAGFGIAGIFQSAVALGYAFVVDVDFVKAAAVLAAVGGDVAAEES